VTNSGGRGGQPRHPSISRRVVTVAFAALLAMQAIGGAGFVEVASAAAPSTTAAPAGNAPIGGSAGEATQNVAEASVDLGTLAGQASGGPFAAQSPLQPGIQYEDALAHEHDPNTFQPGGRVTVPFRPRTSDGGPSTAGDGSRCRPDG
jgi:hypothetical protein